MRNIRDFYVKAGTGLRKLERLYGEQVAAVRVLGGSGGGDKKSPIRNESVTAGIIRRGENWAIKAAKAIPTVKIKGAVKIEKKAAALRKTKTVTIRLLNNEEKSTAAKTNFL